MSRQASSNEWNRMLELIGEIDACDAFLKCYQIRIGLDKYTRKQLVIVQMEKAKYIAELKILARDIAIIPQSVREIYY